MSKVSQDRYIKFDFKLNESEYAKLKKAACLGNVSMAEFIRDALNAKYSKMTEQEAVEPINSYGTFRCGNCRNIVGYNDGHWLRCPYCGTDVTEWNLR